MRERAGTRLQPAKAMRQSSALMDKTKATKEVFGFTRGDSNREMPPLAPAQERVLLSALVALEEADGHYDRHSGAKMYAEAVKNARLLTEEAHDVLPARDLRLNLLDSTLDAYQQAGVLLIGNETNLAQEIPEALAAGGRIRKAFLRQIIEGSLDSNGQDVLRFLLG